MTSDGSVTLNDYIGVLRRRKWAIIVAVVVSPVVALVFAHGGGKMYSASAQVLVNRQNLPANITGVQDPSQLDSVRVLATQAQFARLPQVAGAALGAVGRRDSSPSELLAVSSVTASPSTDFLTFNVSDPDRQMAVRLATAYARQYVVYSNRYRTAQLEVAARALRTRLGKLAAAGAAKSDLYSTLAAKLDQLSTMEVISTTTASLVRPATGAGRPAAHAIRDAMFAFILALLAGVGIAFVWDSLDTRARSADQIGSRLQLRLLARIPRPPRALRRDDALVMLSDVDSAYAEPFRMLRTALAFVRGRAAGEAAPGRAPASTRAGAQPAYRIMVTSAVEGEGKSTTVANLAVAFARSGSKVVLVDLDFRRASLHRFFGISSSPGLTEALLGPTPLSEVGSKIDVRTPGRFDLTSSSGSLRVVPVGALSPNHGDLDFTAGIAQLLDRLSVDCDLVLIDSPPLLQVGDALALTSHVDGVLVVASLHAVRATMLDDLRRMLDETPAAKLGFVVTGAELEEGYGYFAYGSHPHRKAVDAG